MHCTFYLFEILIFGLENRFFCPKPFLDNFFKAPRLISMKLFTTNKMTLKLCTVPVIISNLNFWKIAFFSLNLSWTTPPRLLGWFQWNFTQLTSGQWLRALYFYFSNISYLCVFVSSKEVLSMTSVNYCSFMVWIQHTAAVTVSKVSKCQALSAPLLPVGIEAQFQRRKRRL